jgi:hypothetical protein
MLLGFIDAAEERQRGGGIEENYQPGKAGGTPERLGFETRNRSSARRWAYLSDPVDQHAAPPRSDTRRGPGQGARAIRRTSPKRWDGDSQAAESFITKSAATSCLAQLGRLEETRAAARAALALAPSFTVAVPRNGAFRQSGFLGRAPTLL